MTIKELNEQLNTNEGTIKYADIKNLIVFRVANEAQHDLQSNNHYRQYLEKGLVASFYLPKDETYDQLHIITNDDILLHGWEEQKEVNMLSDARRNTKRIFPADFITLNEVMKLENYTLEERSDVPEDVMYILTNRNRFHGASTLYYSDTMKKVYEILNDDFYVLPSSRHEVIIVPHSIAPSLKGMEQMVQEINTSQLEPVDVLHNHVLFYDNQTGTLQLQMAEHKVLLDNTEELDTNKQLKEASDSLRRSEESYIALLEQMKEYGLEEQFLQFVKEHNEPYLQPVAEKNVQTIVGVDLKNAVLANPMVEQEYTQEELRKYQSHDVVQKKSFGSK